MRNATPLLLTFAVTLTAASGLHAQRWQAVENMSLEVVENSALDFSGLVDAGPAGQHGWAVTTKDGHIGFEKRGAPQRFLAASIAFSPSSGGMPDNDTARRLAAQLKRTGYNAARLHNVDAMLMSGREKDFDFSPEQLDRFHFFLAQLKNAGIYVVLDVMNLDNGAYGGIQPHRWIIKHALRRDMYFEESARQHWLRMLKDMYGRKNPYTGTAPLKDPAVLALILVNEGGLAAQALKESKGFQNAPSDFFKRPFQNWLKKQYGSTDRLRGAWGTTAGKDVNFETASLPPSLRGNSPRHIDFMRFAAESEQALFKWMDNQVKALGYGGLTTAFNNWSFQASDIARSATSIVDMHGYHNLPAGFVNPGAKVEQTSAIGNSAKFIREIGGARQWGKPFMVTEYGQPFWNRYRREAGAIMPAYASLQDWDLITHFAENPLILSYKPASYARGKAIYPWGIGSDPVLRASERLAAVLFKRGDVSPARSKVKIHVEPSDILDQNAGWSQLPEGMSRLMFVTQLGLSLTAAPSESPDNELAISARGNRFDIVRKVKKAAMEFGLPDPDDWMGSLKQRTLASKTNRTNLGAGIYESATGQLFMDAGQKRFTVNTDRTALVNLVQGSARAGLLELKSTSAPALVALTSLDQQPLASSKRMLLFVLTDALNAGMTFSDDDRTTLKSLGGFPPEIETTSLDIRLHGRKPAGLKVYPLNLDGTRRAALPIGSQPSEGAFALNIDTADLKNGPTTYLEIVAE